MAIPSTTEPKYTDSKDRPSGRYARFLLWRNRMLRSKTFQKWAARLPIAQSIARTRATDLHHILAGFVYSQTLSAAYKLGLLECLKDRIATLDEIARACELEQDAALTLIKAATAIDLLQEVDARHLDTRRARRIYSWQPGCAEHAPAPRSAVSRHG